MPEQVFHGYLKPVQHRPVKCKERPDRHGPARVEGASWQAGVTRNHAAFRPMIDGEAEPLCFAANVAEGWGQLYVLNDDGNIRRNSITGDPVTRRRFGRVALIPSQD